MKSLKPILIFGIGFLWVLIVAEKLAVNTPPQPKYSKDLARWNGAHKDDTELKVNLEWQKEVKQSYIRASKSEYWMEMSYPDPAYISFSVPGEEEVIYIESNGDIYIHGRLAANDKEVVNAFRELFGFKHVK